MPITKFPDGVPFKPGEESPYAGRGSFYQLQYGNYLIGMTSTRDKTYALKLTKNQKGLNAPDLVSGQPLSPAKGVNVPPFSTVVLYLGK